MISQETLNQFHTKTIELVSNVAKKVWDNKLAILPAVILGYGIAKNKIFEKTDKGQKSARAQTVNGTVYTAPDENPTPAKLIGRRDKKRRIYVSNLILHEKLTNTMISREESMFSVDSSTSCQSDKESLMGGRRKRQSYLEDYSDVDSIPQENKKIRKKKGHVRRSSEHPDDLFFNIYQQFK